MLTLDGIDRSFLNRAGIYLPKLVHATSFAGGYPCCCSRRGSSTSSFPSGRSGTSTSSGSTAVTWATGCSTCIDGKYPLVWQVDTGSLGSSGPRGACLEHATFFSDPFAPGTVVSSCQRATLPVNCSSPDGFTFTVRINTTNINVELGTSGAPNIMQWILAISTPYDCLGIAALSIPFSSKNGLHPLAGIFPGAVDPVTITAL